MTKNLNDMKKAVLKKSEEIGGEKIIGYDFEKDFDEKLFFNSFKNTGFQATNLGRAIEIVKKMRKEKVRIFLGFTSNMATSGIRDIITYLTKNKLIYFMVTTTGGIEEDIIKTHKNFLQGDFDANGSWLRKKGVNRTGNIFIPNDRYVWFESFIKPVLKRLFEKQKKEGKICNSVEFIKELGKELEKYPNKKSSFVYWAYKNNISLLCVPLADGAIGDHIYMFKKENPDFKIDLIGELELMIDTVLEDEKSGAIIIGGSVPKHHIMNAFMMREGIEYTVYINTGFEGEGSNAGANIEEAKSWGKASFKNNS
ncbi:MAG: deoxyhypusine synthase, partial [Candidatus ainarchaeum sp.]|nr:deoxyhypusine synthase [Candidatus ainarchaeum sp.]